MARLAINPTRMELLRLRKRLVVARRGHKLLKDKLEGLMKEFLVRVEQYREFRQRVDQELPQYLKLFSLAETTSSRVVVEDALEQTRYELHIRPYTERIMSVKAPRFDTEMGTSKGSYSLVYTPVELDAAIRGLQAFLPTLLRLIELDQTIRLLAAEIEKTRRRVNALEYTFIPQMVETIKYITTKLDEMERSNISRLMKIKAQRADSDQGGL
jgi:V/A-type H+-transporting ATPase subunit D